MLFIAAGLRAFDCHSACRLRCKWDEPPSPARSVPVRACTLKCISMQVHLSVSRAQYIPLSASLFILLSYSLELSNFLFFREYFWPHSWPRANVCLSESQRMITKDVSFRFCKCLASAKVHMLIDSRRSYEFDPLNSFAVGSSLLFCNKKLRMWCTYNCNDQLIQLIQHIFIFAMNRLYWFHGSCYLHPMRLWNVKRHYILHYNATKYIQVWTLIFITTLDL